MTVRIELFNQSKYRDGAQQGDDVPLILPGHAYGVFDGATDPRGTRIGGVPAGRFAALTVSAELAAIALEPAGRELPARALVERLAGALERRTAQLGLPIPPSTTLAVALDCGREWRFVLLGDSGIRLNGSEVLRREKIIDDVSTAARVKLFETFRPAQPNADAAEYATRRAIFLGLGQAVDEGRLDSHAAEGIVAATIAETGLSAHAETVAAFLHDGIQKQYRYGNGSGPLAFDTMNGTRSELTELIDERRPKSEIKSIEIFSDGYPAEPAEVSVSAWEQAFHHAEAVDYHKTGAYRTVKGSTSTEVFDDRTILILRQEPG